MKYALILFFVLLATQANAAAYSDSITDDGTVCISPQIKKSEGTWQATIRAYGTWGSGTVSWFTRTGTSNDVTIFDLTGVAYTSSANDQFNIDLGKSSYSGTDMKVCGTMAGSTNPSVTVELYDNN